MLRRPLTRIDIKVDEIEDLNQAIHEPKKVMFRRPLTRIDIKLVEIDDLKQVIEEKQQKQRAFTSDNSIGLDTPLILSTTVPSKC
ncbi:unnamed protein product [Didymodactylos carnosus]|uniref:Uncharacterized protein n=1 Tax=Didymodactylos carnosus TaxID=1234261 RepID=A0A815J131_9BILA|nr:unnamed protein product [Didymodactylos carnosus]CAF1562258.1 unnamed protein product [Didymodactylos carnosus]CAF4266589.1 unnamed protein product [Didymodactylos carnosus]CAF4354345.1 unnamed protein product [Didymodactylos carnosus]